MTAKIISACTYTKSEDGGSCGPRVPCDGRHYSDGDMRGGCGEPCRFVMMKSGEGNPPMTGHPDAAP